MIEIGKQFGSWTVVATFTTGRHVLCRCACGTEKMVRRTHLVSGASTRCRRCYRTHGHRSRTSPASPTYNSWIAMKDRCTNRNDIGFSEYGGRGITVCERWLNDFPAFLADMGERPAGTTLDRIDNDRGYEPSNVRWATAAQQTRNRRVTKLEPHEPDQIRWLCALGYSQQHVATFFGIARSTVGDVVNGTRWSQPTP